MNQINLSLDFSSFCHLMETTCNCEMICFMSARFLNTPDTIEEIRIEALNNLESNLIKLKADESPEEYLSMYKNGSLSNHYIKMAVHFFSKGDFEKYDHYIQRSIALKNIFHDSSDITIQRDSTRKYISDGFYDLRVKLFEIERDKRFPIATIRDAEIDIVKWLKDVSKNDLAEVVFNILKESPKDNLCCLELGCHAGTLLHLIKNKVGSDRPGIQFIGIEPEMMATEIGKARFPDLDIRLGNHELLGKERNKLPDNITVLLLSTVLLLNSPDVVDYIFSFARDNVETMVIMDDIANYYGDFAVFRRYYLLHPYNKLFKQYSFVPSMVALPGNHNQAITGIIVAENNNHG